MNRRLLSDEWINTVARVQEEIGIGSFPIGSPEDFDRYVDLHKTARHIINLEEAGSEVDIPDLVKV